MERSFLFKSQARASEASLIVQFGATVFILCIVGFLQKLLWPFILTTPYLLFYPAILIISFFFGPGLGFFSILAVVAITQIYFVSPFGELSFDWSAGVFLPIFFIAVSSSVVWLGSVLRRSRVQITEGKIRFEAIFEHAAVGMALVSKDGELLAVNEKLCDILGRSSGQISRLPLNEILDYEEGGEFSKYFQNLFKGVKLPNSFEKNLPHPQKVSIDVSISMSLLKSSRGHPSQAIVVIRDITEQKRSEKSAKFLGAVGQSLVSSLEYKEVLKSVASLSVPEIADWCVVDLMSKEGKIERMSVAHSDPKKEALVWELQKKFPPRIDAPVGAGRVIRTGQSEFMAELDDALIRLAARDEQHLQTIHELGLRSYICVPLIARGRALGAITLVREAKNQPYTKEDMFLVEDLARPMALAIDNARSYHAVQAAIQARDEFLSIASHELKTPLSALKLQTQMRRRHVESKNEMAFTFEKLEKMFSTDERQIDRLTKLVEDMLDISRISAGQLHIEPGVFDISELVREMVDRFNPHSFGASSLMKVHAATPVIGEWDRHRIEQVLMNLFTNAWKYGDGKPVDVEVFKDESWAYVKVRDRGRGVSKEDQARIFGRFERVAERKNISGLGLGLYITREILHLHGGEISVESELGEGATFNVKLPLRRAG